MYDIAKIRADFPILSREVNAKPLVYLDNGASAQKPQCVIDAITQTYRHNYANVHRGLHYLSNHATDAFEATRETLRVFLNAAQSDEIVFTTGSTAGLNLVSYAWGVDNLKAGDQILLSSLEHHANIVPWHFLRERYGIELIWVDPDPDGALPAQKVIEAITAKTKLIAITHMSNVLGTRVDIAQICAIAQSRGIATVIDGSQAAVHQKVDMQEIGCDFYAITGHKLYGPTASGALYINARRHDELRPFIGGGAMIDTVSKNQISYNAMPHLQEAGTPGIVEMIGLGVAIEYMQTIGMDHIAAHEAELRDYALSCFKRRNWLHLNGHTADMGAIFSFTIDGQGHPHDVSTILDQRGIAVRAGHHCAQPLMDHLGLSATTRASFGLYNTKGEIDALMEALETCHDMFS